MNLLPLKLLRRTSGKFLLKMMGCSLSLYSVLAFYNWASSEYKNPWDLNYFLDTDTGDRRLENVIDTPNCKILKISPWDQAILPFIKPKTSPPNCKTRNRNWTFLRGSKLFMNESAIRESGYSLSSLKCCYKAILRVEQTFDKYDMAADNEVRYSDNCKKLGKETEIQTDFIRVFCTSTSWPYLGEVVYRTFYALAIPSQQSLRKKQNVWKTSLAKNKSSVLPPNVVMIGIDSLSRMNFHRSFNLTKSFLQEIGAVEFMGYTKVGENTFPNTVAFLTGYSDSDLQKTCNRGPEVPQDLCPYIWKRFDEANYLTATVEDAPGLVGFNYHKLGFVNKPTDFYFRPFMLAVHKSLPRMDYYHTDCIGRQTTEETLLSYIQGIMNHSSTVPVFVHSWMTSLAHLDINGARFADSSTKNFLSAIDLSNTILILLSDHGQRYGAIRETLPGWYEDKLPIFTIYLPPTVRKLQPEWQKSLEINSKRLTSPFDLYRTFNEILDAFTNSQSMTGEVDPQKVPPGNKIHKQYGQSLFSPVNRKRSCGDAGIPVNYCACVPPKKLNASDPLVVRAAKAAVTYLNQVIPEQCAQLTLDRVSAGAIMTNEKGITYVVTFYTKPGDFMFEANAEFNQKTNQFTVRTDLLRMNKIVRDASCVTTSLLERYCYCS